MIILSCNLPEQTYQGGDDGGPEVYMEYSNDIVEGPSMGMAMATIHDDSCLLLKQVLGTPQAELYDSPTCDTASRLGCRPFDDRRDNNEHSTGTSSSLTTTTLSFLPPLSTTMVRGYLAGITGAAARQALLSHANTCIRHLMIPRPR